MKFLISCYPLVNFDFDVALWMHLLYKSFYLLIEAMTAHGLTYKKHLDLKEEFRKIANLQRSYKKLQDYVEEMELINSYLAQVTEELDKKVLELSAIERVTKEMSQSYRKEEIIDIAFEALKEVIKFSDFIFFDKEKENKKIISRATGYERVHSFDEDSICRRLIKEAQESRKVKIDKIDGKSYIVVPLIAENTVLGSIILCGEVEFAEDEKRFAGIISSHTAMALSNVLTFHKVKEKSITDDLTGLYNRRFFTDCFKKELERARQEKKHLSLLWLDLDDFKKHNDTYGHLMGDKALVTFAGVLKRSTRQDDICFRYGGEEFAIILKGVDKKLASKIAERIREATPVSTEDQKDNIPGLTVSIGIAIFPDEGESERELIKKADDRLYKAKMKGKNRVWV